VKILGIIPARGGSKRLPRKNIADLGGKPLLMWTLDTAIASEVFDELWVSSEDPEIGELAGKHWWKRPQELARDDTPTMDVLENILEHKKADIVVTLQVTSPFRTVDDIKNALELLKNTNADSVISVTDGPRDLAFHMRFANRLQGLPPIVVCNGAIYIITNSALERGLDWYNGFAYGYKMPKERSLDIDNGTDLEIARHLVASGLYKD
jgi:CMP-N,N'-diacetyllegionaminic acid synthase